MLAITPPSVQVFDVNAVVLKHTTSRCPVCLAACPGIVLQRGDRIFLERTCAEHGEFSAFHLLASDEVLHFYDGDPLHIYEIDAQGRMKVQTLGRDLTRGERFAAVVPGGSWFALRCEVEGGFSLIGCTVAPGFDFEDFKLDDRAMLVARFPQHAGLIREMTFDRS